MNTPGSYSSESNQINNLSNHDNFFLDQQGEQIRIYPELVEVAEHIALGFDKHPEFKNKIVNAEYDMLIGDDVSGRPVTLMLKHIIDHFRKENGLHGGIENIFIDDIKYITEKRREEQIEYNYNPNISLIEIKNKIRDRNILVTTELINKGNKINEIVNILNLKNLKYDIFTQSFNIGSNLATEIEDKVIFGIREKRYIPKVWRNTNLILYSTLKEFNQGFSTFPYRKDNTKIIKETRKQIKLLGDYIIKYYLEDKKLLISQKPNL